jgi:dihydroorotase
LPLIAAGETQLLDAVIEGGLIVSPEGVKPASIAVHDGKVAAIGAPGEKLEARERINVSGCMVLPGLVDAHVHFREPGLTHKEDFGSGTRAAAAGGVTTVMVMPTDKPMTTTPELFAEKRALAEKSAHVDFALQAGLGPDITHVRALCDLGAISFEVFLADLPPPMLVAAWPALRRATTASWRRTLLWAPSAARKAAAPFSPRDPRSPRRSAWRAPAWPPARRAPASMFGR